jgi:hypothetical protein
MADTVKCEHCDAVLRNTPRSIGSHMGYHHKDVSQQIYSRRTEFTMQCLECGNLVANSNNVLARHVRKVHCMDWPDYEIKHLHGGVVPKCKCGCGQDLMWRKGGFAEYVTGHSSRGVGNPMFGKKGEQNPNTGKRRTCEMRSRYSDASSRRWSDPADPRREIFASDEYRQTMRISGKEVADRPEVVQRKSEWSRGWWDENPEMRKVWSSRAISLLEQGKIGPQAPYRAEWKLNPFTGREEYMHSSWETRFLDECMERGVPVTKQHGIRIPYVDPNGQERTYVPDFLSLDGRTLYEVKGYETDTDREKWRATMAWCLANDATHEVVQYDRA